FFCVLRCPRSILFPYTTLFRSTAGGLWRYRLGDRVVVDGFRNKCPSLTFIGRSEDVSDLCGEKLSAQFVKEAIDEALGQTRPQLDRKSTRLNSSHQIISYAVFC